ncbi:glycosyltransferase family 2 protein [Nocardioides sp.]|uniref:glycosyltransferase family 2 protein n=1 Tax=Nocardioides sp. TaxID=35761 RepID=UPI001A18E011|nr:glycosyltransferase family 2 protein [Nocardioides sp.]MBJ7358175.1 glycosyltransferase family 2 protein [Nocardioides sp.]
MPVPTDSRPTVTAVILAWGDEPVLEESVRAVLASEDVRPDVVLVDNGCTSDAVEVLASVAGVTVVRPGRNLGFAAGCNLGADRATGEFLAFVNGDAVVRSDALGALVAGLGEPGSEVGLTTASLRLYDDPETLNSAGNPVHYLGLSWAGGLGLAATAYEHGRSGHEDVTSTTGAATAVRADRFAALGGFCEPMFAYCEDTDLSLRCWQRGWRVVLVPEAIVLHRYEFSRNPQKLYLLERNRLLMVLTVYSGRLLAAVLVPLVAMELAMLAMAVKGGWAGRKVAGWWWLLRHAGLVRRRRREVQAARVVPDTRLAELLSGDVTPGVDGLSVPTMLRRVSVAYWSLARRAI